MIYIQSDSEKNIPHHFDAASAMYGAIETGQDFKLVSYEDLKSGKFDILIKGNLFVGSVEFMTEVFSRIGLTKVKVPKNSNRKYKIMTIGEVKERAKNGEKWFIKPFQTKLFTGFVIDEMFYTSISDIPDDLEIMAYEPFESTIVSEWRTYVSINSVKDIRNYSGDVFTIPSKDYIESIIIENAADFPDCYTIDVAVLENGENVVVEFNDMWAIGNYGLDNGDYISMLKKRYFQIIKQ